MIKYAKYSSLLLPDTFQIFGLELKPFCLGHYILMERFGCSIVDKEIKKDGLNDFLLALAICHRTYEGFLEFISDTKGFSDWCLEWGQAVKQQIDSAKEFDLALRITLFKEYMEEGITIPYIVNEEEGKESGSQWTQNIIVALTSELGYTRSEALNKPLSLVIYDFYKLLENKGKITFMTTDNIELEEMGNK